MDGLFHSYTSTCKNCVPNPPNLITPRKTKMTNGKNNHVHEDISPIQKHGNFPTIVILVGQVTSMPQRIDAGKDLQTKKESSPIGIWKLLREPKTLNPPEV